MSGAYDGLTHIGVDVRDGVAWAVIDHPPINLWDRDFVPDLVGLLGGFADLLDRLAVPAR